MTEEQCQVLMNAENEEQLATLARENGLELTEREVKELFAAIHPVKGCEPLDDDMLQEVVGGASFQRILSQLLKTGRKIICDPQNENLPWS